MRALRFSMNQSSTSAPLTFNPMRRPARFAAKAGAPYLLNKELSNS